MPRGAFLTMTKLKYKSTITSSIPYCISKAGAQFESVDLRLRVMRLILNIIFSGLIVILAYKSMTAFRFTLWLLSVMNTSIKD